MYGYRLVETAVHFAGDSRTLSRQGLMKHLYNCSGTIRLGLTQCTLPMADIQSQVTDRFKHQSSNRAKPLICNYFSP